MTTMDEALFWLLRTRSVELRLAELVAQQARERYFQVIELAGLDPRRAYKFNDATMTVQPHGDIDRVR